MLVMSQVSLINYYNYYEGYQSMKLKIYQAIKRLGLCTATEIMRELGVKNPNRIRPRITELYKEGLIIKAGIVDVINADNTIVQETVYKIKLTNVR